jgi:hypothetical protein
MSWRRLTVLIRGLSPHSIWVLRRRAHLNPNGTSGGPGGPGGGVRRITDPAAIEAFICSLGTKKVA